MQMRVDTRYSHGAEPGPFRPPTRAAYRERPPSQAPRGAGRSIHERTDTASPNRMDGMSRMVKERPRPVHLPPPCCFGVLRGASGQPPGGLGDGIGRACRPGGEGRSTGDPQGGSTGTATRFPHPDHPVHPC
jgi:hypothetical protein